MVAQGVRFRSGADDEHVARIQTAVEAPIEEHAIDEPPQAQGDGDQAHRADHDAARNVVGMHQVKRAGEQQARSETGLRAEALLVQKIGEALRRVQVHAAAGGDERKGEAAEQSQQNAHRPAVKQGPVPKSSARRSGEWCGTRKDRGHSGSQADRQDIQEYPELGRAASGPRGATRGARFPFGRNAREDDSLCQKSELAIGGTQTSNFQKRLDGVLLRLIRKGMRSKAKIHHNVTNE